MIKTRFPTYGVRALPWSWQSEEQDTTSLQILQQYLLKDSPLILHRKHCIDAYNIHVFLFFNVSCLSP